MRVGADAGEFPDSQAHRKDLFSRRLRASAYTISRIEEAMPIGAERAPQQMHGNWSPASISSDGSPGSIQVVVMRTPFGTTRIVDTRIFPERMSLRRAQRILRR
jgi:hypothetical protein